MGNNVNCNSCAFNINQELHIQLIRGTVTVNNLQNSSKNIKRQITTKTTNFKKNSKNLEKNCSLSRNSIFKILSELTNQTTKFEIINIVKLSINNYTYLGPPSKEGDTLISGFGIFTNEISKYSGNLELNIPTGVGKYIYYPEKKKYIGEFADSKANGYGILTTSSKTIFEGYWLNDSQFKEGTEKWVDGSVYQGNYINGIKKGIGIYKWPDGSIYQGEWENDEIHGWGIYKFNDGRIYKGRWRNNQMDGYGEYILEDGKKYIGYFKKDKKSGFGIYYWPTSGLPKAYVGMWKEGKMDGYGIQYKGKVIRYCKYIKGKRKRVFNCKDDFWKEAIQEINNLENQFSLTIENIEGIIDDVDDDIGVD